MPEYNSDTIHGFAIGAGAKVTGEDRVAYKPSVPSDGVGKLDGMVVLADGRLLSGTTLGTQITPPVSAPDTMRHLVIPSPQNRSRNNYVRISPDGTWLYTAYAADILRRRLRPDFGSVLER